MRKKRKNNIIVPVASMGDIAFLLIIFFMVCSNFKNYEVVLPSAKALENLERTMISVGIDKTGQIYLDGMKVDGAEDVQYGVAAKIEQRRQGLEPGQSDVAIRTILFRCDRNIDREIFQPVFSAISRGGGIIAAVGNDQDSK